MSGEPGAFAYSVCFPCYTRGVGFVGVLELNGGHTRIANPPICSQNGDLGKEHLRKKGAGTDAAQ